MFGTREGVYAMRHHNSVLHEVLKQVPWGVFDTLVEEHGSDARVRRLSTKGQFIALIYAQLSGAASLREIEMALRSHSARLYHLGAAPVSRSTLADANAGRLHRVFAGLFSHLAGLAGRRLHRQGAEAVRLIDSTGVRLGGIASRWARFSDKACGAKAHIVYDPDADAPLYLEVTPAKVNDIPPPRPCPSSRARPRPSPGQALRVRPWLSRLRLVGEAGSGRLPPVTRLKRDTPLSVTCEQVLPPGSALLYDRIGRLPARLSNNRDNPFAKPVREIAVRLDDGKALCVLSNDLDAPAQEIADLYKRRWAIELFFRWVKQTLKIRHFLGTSENAVRIQIAVALIAFLLLRLANQSLKLVHSPLAFARLVRTNLMRRRRIDQLLQPPPDLRADPRDNPSFKLRLAMNRTAVDLFWTSTSLWLVAAK